VEVTKVDQKESEFFLPNFCGVKPLFILTIGAELLAIVLILATGEEIFESWDELGLLSIFVQWIALGSAAILCISRSLLAKLPLIWSAIAAYLIIILVTAVISMAAEYFIITTDYLWGYDPNNVGYFMFRCVCISAIISLVALRYFYMQQQWKEKIELESQARIQALQSRIRPHFLFNSMNIIASLISLNPALAEQAVEDLSELFRATLRKTSSLVPLSEEWILCRHYLRIEGLRLGDRLKVDWQLSDVPDDVAIPMLTLQPLMENAIYHGIQPLPEGGEIKVSGFVQGNQVEISITNPIPRVKAISKGHGIALANIRHRLNLLFGTHAKLLVQPGTDQYKVVLCFPYIKAAEIT
jgi:two-component system, LytTR family, sensor histidine kinase AlgZ